MFTGLIEALGTVRGLAADGSGGAVLTIVEPRLAPELADGESVAVNGACLTVVDREGDTFRFQLGPETLQRTNLGQLKEGERVNLERSLRVGDRLGGHFVQGHVDAVGTLLERVHRGEWEVAWFAFPKDLGLLMVAKGSIAVDGVSLTLVEVEEERFSVMLIPHTLQHTTLGRKDRGDAVNLETDMIAKHVKRLFDNVTITI
jgi:riboflavin synthase